MQYVVLLLSLISVARACLPFVDCGSMYEITDVKISGCDNEEEVCEVKLGDVKNLEIYLSSALELDSMTSAAYISMYGQKFPVPVNPVNVCETTFCPITHTHNITKVNSAVTFTGGVIPGSAKLYFNSTVKIDNASLLALCFYTDVKLVN
ncbi:uncharacterized protein LOC109595171 [Aethina tumida]|uniref:uncharacterized protein LOC109595171 n=1 Tax=Aethina tumida TaxID=116153 RepID=UPI00096B19B6|nr:uncharacterized protein LOC109595171 [Aethina tumida]